MGYLIGVDIGGTFTDCAVIDERGALTPAKVPTTPDNPADAFFAAIERAAEDLGLTAAELLAQTDRLSHGSTIVTNAVVTKRGARVGLLATRGHGDTLKIKDGSGRITGVTCYPRLSYTYTVAGKQHVSILVGWAPGDIDTSLRACLPH